MGRGGAGGRPAACERTIRLKESADERVVPTGVNKHQRGHPNYVRTSKFTPLTWLPLSLFNQFKRTANVYFLFIAVIVLFGSFVSDFSPKDWRSKIGPFVFVLLWTALKDLYEDFRRREDDKRENSRVVKRYSCETKAFEETFWRDVLVGDLLFVECDEPFPADLVLLQTKRNDTAFISTVMLDGETSLKERCVPQVLAEGLPSLPVVGSTPQAWEDFEAAAAAFVQRLFVVGSEVKLGAPSPTLADVRGLIAMEEKPCDPCPLGEANFLPRGCILRNTPFALAVCAYAGAETKTWLNATEATLKFSNMQRAFNHCVVLLLLFVVVVCLYATTMSSADLYGLGPKKWPFYIMFLRFSIAFYHAVPMSLYVVYEMLKLLLGFRVNRDEQMFYEGQGASARTADLMEEMGQVDFVFSDKTGTLTANDMVFAHGHVDGRDFGDFRPDREASPPVLPEGLVVARSALTSAGPHSEAVLWFFTCLATCHEVVLDMSSAGSDLLPTYTGMSPDEVALVSAARDAGVVLERRGRPSVAPVSVPEGAGEEGAAAMRNAATAAAELMVRDPMGHRTKYEALAVLQFSSDRKRMSVVVRAGKRAWCITKGADSVMEGRLEGSIPDAARADILKFSRAGLRVLVVAARELDREFLQGWLAAYQQARGVLDHTKDAKVAEVIARMETNLRFVGVTAVEDRLQEGVPEAIHAIKRAGARIWVLTGDKTETAVNIAYSCALFGDSTKLGYVTDCASAAEAKDALERARRELKPDVDGSGRGSCVEGGLVIDGGSLLQALNDDRCRRLIVELGRTSRSCICSRLSPMQKLQIVQLVRSADPKLVALTIGDGANDVPMILGGNVGIGVRGKEGAAAVQVCDVAISQFRFLVPLLLCHGRRAYRRVAVFFCYYLYKNIALLVADLVWMHWDNFDGNIAFAEYLSIAYNAFFTSWHILFVLGFDRDVPDEVALQHPSLYKIGTSNKLFNAWVFSSWMVDALVHGIVAWLVPFHMIGTSDWHSQQFWVSSTCAFANVVHICLLKLVIVSQNPVSMTTLLPTLGAWLMFVFYLWGLCYTSLGWSVQPNMKYIFEEMFATTGAVTTLIISPPIALLINVAARIIQRYVFPDELQRIEMKLRDNRVSPGDGDM